MPYKYLKEGGIFRCVVPDLEHNIKKYLKNKEEQNPEASLIFMKETYLGWKKRPKKLLDLLIFKLETSNHFWMWDAEALIHELKNRWFLSYQMTDKDYRKYGRYEVLFVEHKEIENKLREYSNFKLIKYKYFPSSIFLADADILKNNKITRFGNSRKYPNLSKMDLPLYEYKGDVYDHNKHCKECQNDSLYKDYVKYSYFATKEYERGLQTAYFINRHVSCLKIVRKYYKHHNISIPRISIDEKMSKHTR